MLPLFSLAVALQGFCLYHAYQSRSEQKWYYLIIFLPYIGSAIYLYDSFYNRKSIKEVTEVVNHVVNNNYKIDQLEKDVEYNSSATNNIRLADAYLAVGRHKEAAELYESCHTGFLADDESLRRKLVHAWYLSGQYEKSESLGQDLMSTKDFKNAEERISFAWSLHHLGKTDQAQKHFEDMNRTFTNYAQRLSFCDFLITTKNNPAAKQLAGELASEFEMMKGPERRLYRDEMKRVSDLQQSLGK